MQEKKEINLKPKEEEVAELYLETLLAEVDTNKYKLVNKILEESHKILEEKMDPLKESVDDTLREAARRLVKAKRLEDKKT
jgi:hypothetical protein